MKLLIKTNFLKNIRCFDRFRNKTEPHTKIARKTVNTDTIRTRIKSLGWTLHEIPVGRSENAVTSWKLVAAKGYSSIETTGKTLDEAMKNMGVTLGVVAA